LFDLKTEQLAALERMGEKSAQKLQSAILASKHTTLPRFLYALGMRDVGEATALALAQHFGDIAALRHAGEDEIQRVPDVGPVVAKNVAAYFRDPGNAAVVDRLLANGITWPARRRSVPTRNSREDLRADRHTAGADPRGGGRGHRAARRQGGRQCVEENALRGGGTDAGSKLKKAQQLGITVLDEAAFMKLLNK